MEDDGNTQDSEEDEVQSSEEDEPPSTRPLFTCLVVMPKIQGIQTCSMDVKRSRLCTVTNTHVKDGRYSLAGKSSSGHCGQRKNSREPRSLCLLMELFEHAGSHVQPWGVT
eukprot:763999-Hanusia_phi.AAC.2